MPVHFKSTSQFKLINTKTTRWALVVLGFVVIGSIGQLTGNAQDVTKLLEGMKALNEAQQLIEQGNPKRIHQGIKRYQDAQVLMREGGQPAGAAAALAGIGMAYSTLEEWGNAIDSFEKAITLARQVKEPFIEATSFGGLAFTYTASHQYAKAVEAYETALKMLESDSDQSKLTMKSGILIGLGMNSVLIGEQKKGFGYLEQALAIKRSLKDRSGEALVLTSIGVTYAQIGQKQTAFDLTTKALKISREIGDKNQEIQSLGAIASIYRDAGENQKALEYFDQVLVYRKSKEDRNGEADSLKKIADVYSNMGEVQLAFDYFNNALQIKRDTATLNNLGEMYASVGEFQKALDLYVEALPLEEAEDDRRAQAATLANLGGVYFNLGERSRAIDYFNRALPLMRAMNDPTGQARILGRIAAISIEDGDRKTALEYYNRTLQVFRAAGDRSGEINALINIGGVLSAEDPQKALSYYAEALPVAERISDRPAIATVLNNTGDIYRAENNHTKALEYYGQAINVARAIHDRQKEVATLGNIAKEERAVGDLNKARSDIESALHILESLRTSVTSRELRASFFVRAQSYFEFYIDLLMELHKLRPRDGFDVLAWQASERARARSLIEMLAEAHADFRKGVDAQLVARERSLQQQLDAQALLENKLQAIPHTEAETASIATQIERLTTDLQQVQAQIRNSSPQYASLTQPPSLTLTDLQSQLDEETLLLEFLTGEENSYLWAITAHSINSYQLPGRKEIEEPARQVYDSVISPDQWSNTSDNVAKVDTLSYPENAIKLSQMLLSPVASQLGHKRLLIVSDGILQYIPFAALPNPQSSNKQTSYARPLIVDHEIISLPSASTLPILRRDVNARRSPDKSLIAFADPVFESSDERIKTHISATPRVPDTSLSPMRRSSQESMRGPDFSLKRLPGTKREADQIIALSPASQRKEVLGFSANRPAAMSPDLGSYKYVHFATHGLLNSRHPELSGIVLTLFDENGAPQDGFLRTHEIFNLRLNADLVVLSACQTGLGKSIRGEGLVGLTRAFMYAGAPRVVVSLWSVSDEATAELMTRFYRGMLLTKLSPSKALQQAQVSMLKETRFRAPFFWAAFILQGEWR